MNNEQRLRSALSGEADRIMTYDYLDNTDVLKIYGGYKEDKRYSFEELIDINARALKGVGLDITRAVYDPSHHWMHGTVDNFKRYHGADAAGWRVEQSGETGWIAERPFHDLEGLKMHLPEIADPTRIEERYLPYMKAVLEGFHAHDVVHIGVVDAPLCNAYTYTDLELFSMLIYDAPEIVASLIQCFTDAAAVSSRLYTTLPHSVPLHFMGDDCAGSTGPIFSPNFIRESVLPHWKRLAQPLKDIGGSIMFHTDGRYGQLLPIIAEELKADGLNPIERAGCNDIFEIYQMYPELIYFGNVCCEETLPFGNPFDVEDETLELIEKIGSNGKIFIGSSSEVHEAVPLKNIETMYGTVHEYGSLPVDVERIRSRRSQIASRRMMRKD